MEKIRNLEFLAETIHLLNEALETAHKGDDPQLVLIGALASLQLHTQRSALLRAQADPTPNALGWSAEQIDDAINLIDNWLARFTGDNIAEAYEAQEAMRMYYSPYRLLLHLQSIDQEKKLP